jgi:heme/copper-type cytochrome/quinol oxidase subunit 4
MSHHDHSQQQAPERGGFLGSRAGFVLLVFLAIAALLLFTEHRAHVLGAAIYILPFICIFMHMVMHGGPGGHGGHSRGDRRPS